MGKGTNTPTGYDGSIRDIANDIPPYHDAIQQCFFTWKAGQPLPPDLPEWAIKQFEFWDSLDKLAKA